MAGLGQILEGRGLVSLVAFFIALNYFLRAIGYVSISFYLRRSL